MKTNLLNFLTLLSVVCLSATSCHPNKEEYYKLLNENRILLTKNDSLQKELNMYKYSAQKLFADVQRYYEIDDRTSLENTIILLEKYHPESDEYQQSLQLWERKQNEIAKRVKEIESKQKNTDNISQDMRQFISLYNRLIKFKGSSDFKKYGFGKGGKYNTWLTEANKLNDNANLSNFTKFGIVPGHIVSLGYAYVASGGTETEATKSLREIIDKAIAEAHGKKKSQDREEKITLTGSEQVIGHWKVTGPMEIDIKIVKKGDDYISIENNKNKKLIYKNSKYYIAGSKTKEYYKIVNGNIRLCDKDGDFTDQFKFKVENLTY